MVTGGGTSGHVLPALAVLEELVDAGHPAESLRFVGAKRGVDRSLLIDEPYEAVFLPISGLHRSFAPRRVAANLLLPVRLLRSRIIARRLIRAWRPRVVVSVGGYASEPMSRAALAAGVPLVCVSYDRIPGLATRRQARRATSCAVAFPGSPLPRAVVTGAPVRRKVRTLDRSAVRGAARSAIGAPVDALLLCVTGGSLGSGTLNEMVPRILRLMGERPDVSWAVFHVCGTRNLSEDAPVPPSNVWYRRVGYEPNIPDVYAAADLMLCRAGASTIAEVAAVGVPAVLVPWPQAADDHQSLNARWLTDAGAAVLVTDDQCRHGAGPEVVVSLLADEEVRRRLAAQARSMGSHSRAGAIAEVVGNAALTA